VVTILIWEVWDLGCICRVGSCGEVEVGHGRQEKGEEEWRRQLAVGVTGWLYSLFGMSDVSASNTRTVNRYIVRHERTMCCHAR
jgi:hypothetical protein